jgi:hypothetical protein
MFEIPLDFASLQKYAATRNSNAIVLQKMTVIAFFNDPIKLREGIAG